MSSRFSTGGSSVAGRRFVIAECLLWVESNAKWI